MIQANQPCNPRVHTLATRLARATPTVSFTSSSGPGLKKPSAKKATGLFPAPALCPVPAVTKG
jgi:hypothetical protein